MRIQVFLFLHFYLLYLLLNSCDGYDTFWRQSMLVKQSSSFSRKHRILSLQICVHQTIGLTTEFGDWCRNVGTLSKTPVRDTSDLKQRLINTWAAYHKTSSIKQLTNGESGYVHHKGERTSLWTSAKLKPAFLEPTHYTTGCFQRHQQSTEEKANKVSKSEGIRNVEYAYHFWKCADAIYQKIIKISPCLSQLQLDKVGSFFLRHSVEYHDIATDRFSSVLISKFAPQSWTQHHSAKYNLQQTSVTLCFVIVFTSITSIYRVVQKWGQYIDCSHV